MSVPQVCTEEPQNGLSALAHYARSRGRSRAHALRTVDLLSDAAAEVVGGYSHGGCCHSGSVAAAVLSQWFWLSLLLLLVLLPPAAVFVLPTVGRA